MIQSRRSAKCILCNHIAVTEINDLLTNPTQRLQPSELLQWLRDNYPTEPIPMTVHTVMNHRNKHILPDKEQMKDLGKLSIDRRTGKLITQQGRPIEAVGIMAALQTMVTIGITNILHNPESVTPTNTLEALKMIKMLGIRDNDPDEDAWQDSILRPGQVKRKTGKEYIDEITEVIEVTAEETSDDEPPMPPTE
jgi:hypothetical protein